MHSLLIIAHREDESIRDLMEPYWLDLEVEEYCVGEVDESERQRFLDYYNEHTPGYHFSMGQFDELYKAKGEDWNFNRWRKDEDGVWREYSTSNPDMRWDWYEIGGRWAGWLQLKEGAKRMSPLRANEAYLGDINNLDILKAGAVMVNGEWVDIERNYIEFTEVKEYLKGLPDDTVITCVDYHM